MLSRVVGLVFEYATLNGGERSMLAVLDWLKQNDPRFEFVAIAPSIGELNDALNDRQIPVICWSDVASGEAGRSSKPTEDQLASIVRCQNFCLLHANSLAMGRLTGRVAENTGVPTTTHLRDIIKLSNAAIEDLNRNRSLVAVSNATRDFHVTQGVSANRTVVIHNGVDSEQFQPRIRSNKLAIELGLADYPVRIIASIGQIGLRKGQDTLAAAAPFAPMEGMRSMLRMISSASAAMRMSMSQCSRRSMVSWHCVTAPSMAGTSTKACTARTEAAGL